MSSTKNIRPAEFLALLAMMLAVISLSIDILLPAFPGMQKDLNVLDPNSMPSVIFVFMIGFSAGLAIYGPLSDSYGRKRIYFFSMFIYLLSTILALYSTNLWILLVCRIFQGFGAAGARIISMAVVRDCYNGDELTKMSSRVMFVFILVPMVAPLIGNGILTVGSWRAIFVFMVVITSMVMVWAYLRLPETLEPERRSLFTFHSLKEKACTLFSHKQTIGYTLVCGLGYSSVMGYVGTAELLFGSGLYHMGNYFPVMFAIVAGVYGASTLFNSYIVERFGTKKLAHIALLGHLLFCYMQIPGSLYYHGQPPIALFMVLLCCSQFFLSLLLVNFNALALEPLGQIAGTASSFIGFFSTIIATVGGGMISGFFNASVYSIIVGFCVYASLALIITMWIERTHYL